MQASARQAEPTALLNVGDVAAILGVDPRYIYRLVKTRRIRHHRIGKYLRFRETDVRAFVDEQAVPSRGRVSAADAATLIGLRGDR